MYGIILAICCCILCANTAYPTESDQGAYGPGTQAPSVAVRLWLSHSGEYLIEYPFVMNVSRREKIAYTKRKLSFEQWEQQIDDLNAKEEKRRAGVYNRIRERYETLKPEDQNSDLSDALNHIKTWWERENYCGFELHSPARYIVASPDGRYAATSIGHKPVLLINVASLAVRRLAAHGDGIGFNYDPPAVAWSRDSKYLAFSPPLTDKLFVFDIERMTVVSTKTDVAPCVKTIKWSPDGRQIAAFEWRNRRLTRNPLLMPTVLVGHPVYVNDAFLSVYQAHEDAHFSIKLKRRIDDITCPRALIYWVSGGDDKRQSSQQKIDEN